LWAAKKKREFSSRKVNIVIDAGHGGLDPGTRSFGLKEKVVTLDIAKRVYSNLKRKGYRVFLTRSTDKHLSVVDRFQLAQQLKADLFVSIHVNSAAGLERVSGVETHFLDGSPFFGKKKSCQFLFFKDKKDEAFKKIIKNQLREKIDNSRALSNSIQKNILSFLKNKNIDVVDRGVKSTGFRTLLRSRVPSSIVEVGFLTNKKEAKFLSKASYRNFLAHGICEGISEFLDS